AYFLGVIADDALGPIVAGHDPGGTKHDGGADATDSILGPERAHRKAEAHALAPGGYQQGHYADTCEKRDDPAPCRADRAVGPAADEREFGIDRCDGFAAAD